MKTKRKYENTTYTRDAKNMPRRWSQIAIQYYNVIPQQNTAYRTKESKRILLYFYCRNQEIESTNEYQGD